MPQRAQAATVHNLAFHFVLAHNRLISPQSHCLVYPVHLPTVLLALIMARKENVTPA